MNLRKKGIKWVEVNLGKEYVEEFLTKYDNLNQGIPIGDFSETIIFLSMIETIKKAKRKDLRNKK